jgi:formylglycine-generating enzyme required for sulfatase activity
MGSDPESLKRQFPTASRGLQSMLMAETPSHQVTIAPFRLDRFAVTNAEFKRFTHARPEWRKERIGGDYLRHWDANGFGEKYSHLPVVFVTWYAARAYAAWLGKRLPTEAEWEFAARGGFRDSRYPWGNEEPTPIRANYRASAVGEPVPVGSYRANPYGLFDLVGNVWQFCLDPWAEYPAGPVRQSIEDLRRMEQAAAQRRAIRGGSFDADPLNLRVTARDSHQVDHAVAFVGFRCAKSAN